MPERRPASGVPPSPSHVRRSPNGRRPLSPLPEADPSFYLQRDGPRGRTWKVGSPVHRARPKRHHRCGQRERQSPCPSSHGSPRPIRLPPSPRDSWCYRVRRPVGVNTPSFCPFGSASLSSIAHLPGSLPRQRRPPAFRLLPPQPKAFVLVEPVHTRLHSPSTLPRRRRHVHPPTRCRR